MEGRVIESCSAPVCNCFYQIRSLIKQIKDYGVGEEDLFHEDDLMQRANIPRVCKCLKEIAIIVSISQEINQKELHLLLQAQGENCVTGRNVRDL